MLAQAFRMLYLGKGHQYQIGFLESRKRVSRINLKASRIMHL